MAGSVSWQTRKLHTSENTQPVICVSYTKIVWTIHAASNSLRNFLEFVAIFSHYLFSKDFEDGRWNCVSRQRRNWKPLRVTFLSNLFRGLSILFNIFWLFVTIDFLGFSFSQIFQKVPLLRQESMVVEFNRRVIGEFCRRIILFMISIAPVPIACDAFYLAVFCTIPIRISSGQNSYMRRGLIQDSANLCSELATSFFCKLSTNKFEKQQNRKHTRV